MMKKRTAKLSLNTETVRQMNARSDGSLTNCLESDSCCKIPCTW